MAIYFFDMRETEDRLIVYFVHLVGVHEEKKNKATMLLTILLRLEGIHTYAQKNQDRTDESTTPLLTLFQSLSTSLS